MEKSNETSFERMNIAVREMLKEDLEVEVTSCKSHTSCTLKVIACPEEKNTVEVYVPYQIFVGSQTNEVCFDWDVDFWKMALRHLCFEFGVKGSPCTRLMTRKMSLANPREYANFFWKKQESMSRWCIILPEIPSTTKSYIPEESRKNATGDAKSKHDVLKSFEMMGLKFACM